jgi:beta-lactamase class A
MATRETCSWLDERPIRILLEKGEMAWGTRLLCALSISGSLVSAKSLQHADLQKQMEDATRGFDGRVGACVQNSSRVTCVNGDERFPLQSVMKLLVGRDAAFRAYQKDPRDTATPRGMTKLLHSLAENRPRSASSTKRLLEIMTQTATFPDRLKAGVSPGWILAHKTGTSGTWRGVTAATNDVGILTAPDHKSISLAVFIADSRADPADRAALIAGTARMTINHHR